MDYKRCFIVITYGFFVLCDAVNVGKICVTNSGSRGDNVYPARYIDWIVPFFYAFFNDLNFRVLSSFLKVLPYIGVYDLLYVLIGKDVMTSLVCKSAFSLPVIPMWDGTHINSTFCGDKEVMWWICRIISLLGLNDSSADRTLRKSLIFKILFVIKELAC